MPFDILALSLSYIGCNQVRQFISFEPTSKFATYLYFVSRPLSYNEIPDKIAAHTSRQQNQQTLQNGAIRQRTKMKLVKQVVPKLFQQRVIIFTHSFILPVAHNNDKELLEINRNVKTSSLYFV